MEQISATEPINIKEETNTTVQTPKTKTNTQSRKRKRRVIDENERKTIVHEHKVNDLSQRKIATMIGTRPETIRKILRENLLFTKKPRKVCEEKKRVADKMRRIILHEHKVNGLMQKEIAVIAGTSNSTVSRILNEHTRLSGDDCDTCNKRKPIAEDMRNRILHEHTANGLMQKEIATLVGISRASVSRILNEHAHSNESTCEACNKNKVVPEIMRKVILHEHNINGLGQKKIATVVGTSQTIVSRVLSEQNINSEYNNRSRRKMKTIDESDRKTIVHERNINGLSQKEIATMIGTSPSTVRRVLKEHAISTGDTCEKFSKKKPVDEDMRKTILHERNVNGLTINKVAAIAGTSQASVSAVLKAFKETQSPNLMKNLERHPLITEQDELEITRNWNRNPSQTLEELHMSMTSRVSRRNFYRIMRKLGIFP